MTYYEFKHAVSKNSNTDFETASKVVDEVFTAISKTLEAEDRLHIPHFGTFFTRTSKPRRYIHPKTKEEKVLPAKVRIEFAPSATLKNNVEKHVMEEV